MCDRLHQLTNNCYGVQEVYVEESCGRKNYGNDNLAFPCLLVFLVACHAYDYASLIVPTNFILFFYLFFPRRRKSIALNLIIESTLLIIDSWDQRY